MKAFKSKHINFVTIVFKKSKFKSINCNL